MFLSIYKPKYNIYLMIFTIFIIQFLRIDAVFAQKFSSRGSCTSDAKLPNFYQAKATICQAKTTITHNKEKKNNRMWFVGGSIGYRNSNLKQNENVNIDQSGAIMEIHVGKEFALKKNLKITAEGFAGFPF